MSVYFDPDGPLGPNEPQLVLIGRDSNVLDDLTALGTSTNSGEPRVLTAGSTSTADPFIGPIEVVAGGVGTYYLAVSGSGRLPTALLGDNVRLEPIDSIERLFNDEVNAPTGGNTTVEAPINAPFIDTTDPSFTGSGFAVTGPGVGRPIASTFNNSRITFDLDLAPIGEGEPNSVFADAVNLDDDGTGSTLFSLSGNANIGDRFGVPRASVFPSVSIDGRINSTIDRVDLFRFTVENDNATVILDIDNGSNPLLGNAAGGWTMRTSATPV